MSNPTRRRRLAGWGVGATTLAVLVLVLALPGWSGAPAPVDTAGTGGGPPTLPAGSPEDPLASPDTNPLQSEEPTNPRDAVPLPPCWAELRRLDQTLSLEDFRTVLASAVPSRDRFLLTYLEERLTRLVGGDPQKALQVLSWAEQAGGGLELMVYMEALKKSDAVHHPKVSERLFTLAEAPEGGTALRAAAVIGLETQKRLGPRELQRLRALALDVRDDPVAWNATRTLGRVMETDFQQTGRHQAYWEHLLDISRQSEDRAVRGLALEMPGYANVVVDAKSIDALSETMRTDRDPEVREMAAMRLSVTEAPDKALEAYASAFQTENDFCVRWALFRFALRAAGAAALPLAQRFAQQEPRLQQDYLDFQQLYAQGAQDWERIWLEKEKRLYPQHIACMDSHAEGQ